jgi:phosphonate transport system substrate-binding protein
MTRVEVSLQDAVTTASFATRISIVLRRSSMNRHGKTIFALALLLGFFSTNGRADESQGPQFGAKQLSLSVPDYRFAVHPLHNPAKLIQEYQPLIDYLNGRLQGAHLTLEASRDYANFEEKYQARKPEFILPNPWQTLQAMKVGYRVIAMAGEPRDFTGIFVVRRDSELKRPSDLKGKAVSYPSPTALAACIMPQYFLHSHGIDVNTDIENKYVGSQESSIMNAYLKLTAAGATWPTPWRAFQREHPQEAAEMKVIWETESLINNSVMVRDDLPAQVVEQVRKLLLGLKGNVEGNVILAGMETARFLPASDEDYDVVRRYVARFEKEVRLVEKR